ncbi:MAG: VWA domain-containing protein [Gemmatimonadetes bacterium]|nr:VWA domain-containing protein [Gemmatimonadota bacterium]
MGLLAPFFIAAGLIALAVPIVVHLIHRERSETVAFPSLMFLRKIPYRSVRRQKIRHWLLFVLRCLALLLLAAAFARPFLSSASQAAAAFSGGRELVVLLDRSYSMGYGDHWRRALAAARTAVDGVKTGDRATVILFAGDARAANRTTGERAALRAAVDTAQPGSGVTRYAPALKLARQFLEESPLPRREALIISDFQRAGWAAEEVSRLPSGTEVTTVSVADPAPANVSVAGVSFQRDIQAGRERVVVSARLTNHGAVALKRLPVKLELGGRDLQTVTSDIAANGAAGVTFTAFNLPDGVSRGTVRAGPDNLLADNAFHFVLSPERTLSVLLLEPVGGSADLSLYVRRALAVGDRPPFRVESRRVNQLTQADLAGRSVVVSLDAGVPAGDAGRALTEFVTGGGGLLVAMGERSGPAAFGPEAAALLPGRSGGIIERATTSGGRLTGIDVSHPVFEPFSAPRSGDFSSARFFRYRRVTLDTVNAKGAMLARFDDGAPALLERRVGRGTVLLWTSTLDNFWSDLPLQPVYLPFIHQLAKRGGGYTEAKAWFSVGQVADLTDPRTAASGNAGASERENLVAQTPSGGRVVVPPGTSRAIALNEQGFYEVRRPGEGAGTARVVAANLDLSETDFTPLDPQEFAAAVRPQARGLAGRGGEPEPVTAAEREQRQALWWYLLVGAFALLTAETILSNRLSKVTAPAS